jgi:hypothetical protein
MRVAPFAARTKTVTRCGVAVQTPMKALEHTVYQVNRDKQLRRWSDTGNRNLGMAVKPLRELHLAHSIKFAGPSCCKQHFWGCPYHSKRNPVSFPPRLHHARDSQT